MWSGTRNKADIRLHSCFSNARDKNWINGIEARMSIESNTPVKYYCVDLCWYCVIFIVTHCMSSGLRGLLPFCPLHYIITILLFTLYYYHFAHYTIFYYHFALYTILLPFCPLHYIITILPFTLYFITILPFTLYLLLYGSCG
jgi:hypothetical protein